MNGKLKAMLESLRSGRNPCDRIFSHKYLDPDCVMNGCKGQVARDAQAKVVLLEQQLSLLRGIIGSLDDTLSDSEVLGLLREWKKKDEESRANPAA